MLMSNLTVWQKMASFTGDTASICLIFSTGESEGVHDILRSSGGGHSNS